MEIVGRESILQELPGGAALLTAGAEDRPDSGVPLPTHEGSAPLCDTAVNDRSSNALLGSVVGRGNRWIEQKSKDRIAMLDQPFGKRPGLGFLPAGVSPCQVKDSFLDPAHQSIEPILGNLVSHMPEVEQTFEFDEKPLSEALIDLTGQGREEFDVPDQMSQAELLKCVGVLDVCTEEVADDGSPVGLSKNIFENLGASRLCDHEEAEKRGTEYPYPVFDAVVFPSGLIDIQSRFGRDVLLKLVVGFGQGVVDAGDGVAQMTPGNIHIQNLPAERCQGAVGGMQRPFHVTEGCLKTRGEQLSFDHPFRQIRPDHLPTDGTPMSPKQVLGNGDGLLNQLGDLLNLRLAGGLGFNGVAVRTDGGVKIFGMVDLVRPERWPADTFMAGLSSPAARSCWVLRLGWFDDVRGWRFGGVRGVFGELRYLFGKLSDLHFQHGDPFVPLNDLPVPLGQLALELFNTPVELFLGCFHRLLHVRVLPILSDERGPPLEGNGKNCRGEKCFSFQKGGV